MPKKYILLFIGILFVQGIFAQDKMSVKISLINEAVSLPTVNILKTPLHPGFMLGTEFKIREKNRIKTLITTDFGYYYHQNIEHGIILRAGLKSEFHFNFGLSLFATFNFGYIHTIFAVPVYKYQDGVYKKVYNYGEPHSITTLGFGIAYTFLNNPKLFSIFLKSENAFVYPYGPIKGAPFMLFSFSHLGVRFYPFN